MLIEPKCFQDHRGWFYEAFHNDRYAELGLGGFVQDNVSCSREGVLRGLHLQNPSPQGKLVQAVTGAIWDVAVDLRVGSPTFKTWEAFELNEENHRQLFIPEGFGHGFYVLRGPAIVSYKVSGRYEPTAEMTVRWDDPELGIEWPLQGEPTVSAKDSSGLFLRDIPAERLPR